MSNYDLELTKLPFGRGVKVLNHNKDGLLALEKPQGLLSHPNSSRDTNRSLLRCNYHLDQEMYEWKNEDGSSGRAWLLNRLDSVTSGVILLSLNENLTPIIKELFARRKVSKVYHAVVRGKPSSLSGIWEDTFLKAPIKGKKLSNRGVIQKAKSRYHILQKSTIGFPLSLVRLMPLTGRTHQLRMQCAKHRSPIVGDQNYGSFSFNRDVTHETGVSRLMLHSSITKLSYFFNNRSYEFSAESELPAVFHALLSFRPGMDFGKILNQKTDIKKSSLEGRRFNT
jgi:23S rRNA-/tRNA-specific pseudouridylate synthase